MLTVEPDDKEAREAAALLRAIGFDVGWDGEFWLIRDDRGEPAMSGRGTREDLLNTAREEGLLR